MRRLLPLTLLLAAIAATLPSAAGAATDGPWTPPTPVPGSPDGPPLPAFAADGRGLVAWTDTGGGGSAVVASPVVDGAPAEPRLLGADMRAVALETYGRSRIVVAGDRVRGRHSRAVVAFGAVDGRPAAPRALGTGGRDARARSLAVNARGDVAMIAEVCVTQRCGARALVLFVRRAGTSRFGVRAVLARGTRVRGGDVAVNARGDVLAAWESGRRIFARVISAGGTLDATDELGAGVQSAIDVALGPEREALVAWGDQRVSEGDTNVPFVAWVAYRGASGRRFHTAREAGRATIVGTGRYVARPGVRVSLSEARRTVAFTATQDGRFVVAARDVVDRRDGRLGPTEVVATPGRNAILGDLVTTASGDQVALVIAGRAGADPAPGEAQALLAATRPAAGVPQFTAPETIASGGWIDAVSAAADPATGRIAAVWRTVGEPVALASRAPVTPRPRAG